MPKAKTKIASVKPENIIVENLELSKISVSPLNEQAQRRKRFTPEDLADLAGSIARRGVIQPITVRKVGSKYEIAAGERRVLASEIAGLTSIPAIVKDLTDDDVLEIQIIENLQRKDPHPMDEADGYVSLQTKLGWTVEEIGLRVGKKPDYITKRLKLETLSPKVREQFEKNNLTLSHALEIAKYPPDAHAELLSYAFNNFGYESQSLYPLAKFIGQIEKHFLLQLKQAPFSVKAENLRADSLACVVCPERTGASPLLFAESFSDKDACLNRKCWNAKTAAHIQIQRRAIVETELEIVEPEKIEKAISKVPVISPDYYLRNEELKKAKVLNSEQWMELKKKDDLCDFAETGVFFNGSRTGQKQKICRNTKCKKHLGRYSSNGSLATDPDRAREDRLIRKEEILDAKVAENVRRRVLKKCAERFNARKTILTHQNAEEYQLALLTRMWQMQCQFSGHTATIIREILELEKETLSTSSWGGDFREQIANLPNDTRSRLMFLLLVAEQGEIFEANWQYNSQAAIKDLAKDFEVDYQLLDAEERLAQIPMKQKDVFRDYLQQVEAGHRDTAIPRVFSTKWKPED